MASTTRFALNATMSVVALAGLLLGILGLVIQWLADSSKFPVLPPGILVIAVCGGLVVLTRRRWWSPIFAVLVGIWIVVGGILAGELTANLASDNVGTVSGNVVMAVGLVTAVVAGAVAMVQARRRQRS